MRRWPWGSRFTQLQAQETARLFINLSQTAVIGVTGALLFGIFDFLKKSLIGIIGYLTAVLLYLVAMGFLKEVKTHE